MKDLIRRLSTVTFAIVMIFCLYVNASDSLAQSADAGSKDAANAEISSPEESVSIDLGTQSILQQALNSGFVVFVVLLVLILASVSSWAIFGAKWFYLKKLSDENDSFIKSFWDSRSLNDLNGRLSDYPHSPAKEIFKSGYAELVKGSQLKEQCTNPQMAFHAALENLGRSLQKAKRNERHQMEQYLPILAIIASASPFIGLFGTVWGIMNSFENIARTGSASLAAVAPGISEALIATAFGLAAAIPAVIGYNTANSMIRKLVGTLDGFSADFLNIVERYLVTDKKSNAATSNPL